MRGLTDRQRKILAFISEYMELNAMAPSVYEIAEKFTIRPSSVFTHLRALQKKDFISRTSKARSIRINDQDRFLKDPTARLKIPFLNGQPDPQLSRKNAGIYVDSEFLQRKNVDDIAAFIIGDDSMTRAGIFSGDILFIEKKSRIPEGRIAVVIFEEGSFVGYFHPKSDRFELVPANPKNKKLKLSKERAIVLGEAVALYRRYPE